MTNRRGFLSSILAAAAAPAIVSASSIMRVVPVMENDTLTYKMSGRYDINFDQWVEDADSKLALRPNKLLLPGFMMAEAMKILDAEFDRAYSRRDW